MWMILWVAVFSAVCQFDPHSSWLVTDWGLFRAATGAPSLSGQPTEPQDWLAVLPIRALQGVEVPLHPWELGFHHLAWSLSLRYG